MWEVNEGGRESFDTLDSSDKTTAVLQVIKKKEILDNVL